jgi:hypothetical protein
MKLCLAIGSCVSLAAASPCLAADPPAQTIVVTGASLAETGRRLAGCLARHCPPDEDIAATLAHAENLFVAGDYRQAHATTPYWADIGFQVAADGLVGDVEMLRSHGRSDWVRAVVKAIESRVYAPADPASGRASYRVERYSYSSMLENDPGVATRRPLRGPPRLSMLDLTAEPEREEEPAAPAGIIAPPS